jgi:hypothetical protein
LVQSNVDVLNAGVRPPVFARAPKVNSAGEALSTCPIASVVAGTEWHCVHAIGEEMLESPCMWG